jgi:hypothetical protein
MEGKGIFGVAQKVGGQCWEQGREVRDEMDKGGIRDKGMEGTKAKTMSKENETKLPVREVGYQKKNSKVIKM